MPSWFATLYAAVCALVFALIVHGCLTLIDRHGETRPQPVALRLPHD